MRRTIYLNLPIITVVSTHQNTHQLESVARRRRSQENTQFIGDFDARLHTSIIVFHTIVFDSSLCYRIFDALCVAPCNHSVLLRFV